MFLLVVIVSSFFGRRRKGGEDVVKAWGNLFCRFVVMRRAQSRGREIFAILAGLLLYPLWNLYSYDSWMKVVLSF